MRAKTGLLARETEPIGRRADPCGQSRPSRYPNASRDPRLRLPLLLILAVMLLFSGQRLVVFLAMRERFQNVSALDVARSFLVGLRFDLVAACALALPLVIMLIPAWTKLLRARWFRNVTSGYASLAAALTAFACIADFYFFAEFDCRLDHKVLDYLGYDYVVKIIWDDYPIVLIAAATVGVALLARWFFLRMGFGKTVHVSLWRALAWPLVVLPCLFLGIRGSVGPKPINNGPAYFSASMSLAQLTLNGLFTLAQAVDNRIIHKNALSNCVNLLPRQDAIDLAVDSLVLPGDERPENPHNPLRRTTSAESPELDYNVVIVIMESLSWQFSGILGADRRLTPCLDSLAKHGILMDRCFAVGSRTPHAFSGVVCGFPDLPGKSVTRCCENEGHFFTLGRTLKKRGYETIFLYGGSPLYDHRYAFLKSNGFSRFVFEDDFRFRTFRTHLGWCDEDLFDQAHETFSGMLEKPFLAVLLTLSFHRPYEIPEGKVEPLDPAEKKHQELTCVRYADWAIGRFMEKARGSAYFDRTIFVFIADHTGGTSGYPISPVSYRIPFIIYAPSILGTAGKRVSSVCSQCDLSPTIMGILGGRYEHCFFGSDVLHRPARMGRAFMLHSGFALAYMDWMQRVVVVPCGGGKPRIFQYQAPNEIVLLDDEKAEIAAYRDELRKRAVALFQTAEIICLNGDYCLPEQ